MKEKKIKIVKEQAAALAAKYPALKNIIFDDWRGWRFIFDAPEVRRCNNDCRNCGLDKFLRSISHNFKYARLIQAGQKDQKMFGPQKFLNCKTLAQYQACYTYFLLNETKTPEEIKKELGLLLNMRVAYAKSAPAALIENRFKRSVLRDVLAQSGQKKKKIINDYLARSVRLK